MKRCLAVVSLAVMVALAFAAAGCGSRVPSDPPAITGTIASVSPSDGGGAGSILVEGSGSIGDKASLRLSGTTPVLHRATDGSVTAATFADLKVGLRVEAWVDGPVAESYPVQATASVIAIVD
jgi:beta-N-acetylhexosaminidase